MDPDTFRGDVGVEGPDVYWRRRVSVLTGALVVVAVVAWACTSASGGSGSNAPRPAVAGSKDPGSGAGVAPVPSPAATPTPAPTAKPTATRHPAAKPSPHPSRAQRPGDPCERPDLVLGLRGESEVYAKKGTPRFLLTVVNIGRVECTVDVGPRAVEIRIVSGTDRVWSTADCVSGDGVDVRHLRRGIPHVRTVGWDRRRSAPDCRSARQKARDGTYVAMARLGPLRSAKVVFHLR
ncbi:hypothetical protein [Sphaerisporangium corydalis]|uniref:DUF4232 domain-containing protein n=1 Tax=Sphaerisporangium corydalis TaxID=1441875 RepID=A0ABV9ESH8_9ACTN|nr:hypothetical protein [Sphaerisporangium corydalis]